MKQIAFWEKTRQKSSFRIFHARPRPLFMKVWFQVKIALNDYQACQ